MSKQASSKLNHYPNQKRVIHKVKIKRKLKIRIIVLNQLIPKKQRNKLKVAIPKR